MVSPGLARAKEMAMEVGVQTGSIRPRGARTRLPLTDGAVSALWMNAAICPLVMFSPMEHWSSAGGLHPFVTPASESSGDDRSAV